MNPQLSPWGINSSSGNMVKQRSLVKLSGSQNNMTRHGCERFLGMEVDWWWWGGVRGNVHFEHAGNVLRTDLINKKLCSMYQFTTVKLNHTESDCFYSSYT